MLLHLETPSRPAHSSTTTSVCISAARHSWAPNSCLQMVSLGHTHVSVLRKRKAKHMASLQVLWQAQSTWGLQPGHWARAWDGGKQVNQSGRDAHHPHS